MGKVDEDPGENIMDGDRSINNKNGLTRLIQPTQKSRAPD
jgi:hypothetical protein